MAIGVRVQLPTERTSREGGFLAGVGVLSGVNQVLGDFYEPDVEVPRGTTQYVECLVCGDPLSLYENSQGLADDLSTGQGGVERGVSALLIFMGVGNGEGQAGQRRQDGCFGPVDDTEGDRVASIKVESSLLCVDRQRKGQNAAYPRFGRVRSEFGPTKVAVRDRRRRR